MLPYRTVYQLHFPCDLRIRHVQKVRQKDYVPLFLRQSLKRLYKQYVLCLNVIPKDLEVRTV